MNLFFYIQILIFFILYQPQVLSQKRSLENYSKDVFYFGNDSINYRILDPYFGENEPVPLFIFLHGSGERGIDNNSQLVHGSKLFLKETEKIEFNSYVIFPQCPKNSRWSYHKEDPWISKNKTEDKKSISLYGNLVIELIQHLIKEKNIDKNRIYISGLSMGGYGTFDLVSHHPELFAAAAPICRTSNDENKNLFFVMIFLIVPLAIIFSTCKSGSFNEIRNPIMKNPLLMRKINFSSFAIPAAPIPANHPSA